MRLCSVSSLFALALALTTACVTDDPDLTGDDLAGLDAVEADQAIADAWASGAVAVAPPSPEAVAKPNYITSGALVGGFCWNRFVGYGNGFWINTTLANHDSRAHTASWEVRRNGALIDSRSVVAAAGATVGLPTATMSSYYDDTLTFKVDGAPLGYNNIRASAIQYYMYNCEVQPSGNATTDRALTFGVTRVGLNYVGGASPFREGRSTGDNQVYQQSGQRPYRLPYGKYGFDCSGLVRRMWAEAGKPLTQYSSLGMLSYTAVTGTKAAMRPGDLIVKRTVTNGVVSSGHVAIYLGDGDGNGTASILEASPTEYNTSTYEAVNGVNIESQSKYFDANGALKAGWVARRIP